MTLEKATEVWGVMIDYEKEAVGIIEDMFLKVNGITIENIRNRILDCLRGYTAHVPYIGHGTQPGGGPLHEGAVAARKVITDWIIQHVPSSEIINTKKKVVSSQALSQERITEFLNKKIATMKEIKERTITPNKDDDDIKHVTTVDDARAFIISHLIANPNYKNKSIPANFKATFTKPLFNGTLPKKEIPSFWHDYFEIPVRHK